MLIIVGSAVVIASILIGYVASHGHIGALWQPFEVVIIGGAAFGAFLSGTPMRVVKQVFADSIGVLKGPKYSPADYVDLLAMLFEVFNKARKDGLMSLEEHVEAPENSPLFSKYPKLQGDHHLMDFLTDGLRLMVSGSMNAHELEPLLDLELETHHHESIAAAHAVQKISDGLPGFGIVAAVLGIVITMASVGDGDTAAIGGHVAAALVGTFLGILLAYGFVGPLSSAMEARAEADGKAFECVKAALIANLQGYNPTVAVEFARKTLSSAVRPSFSELEEQLKARK